MSKCYVRGSGGAIATFDLDKVPESVLTRIARGEEQFVDKNGKPTTIPVGLRPTQADGAPSLAVLQAQAAAQGEPIPGVDYDVAESAPDGATFAEMLTGMDHKSLKASAEARGLKKGGSKADLLARIEEHDLAVSSGDKVLDQTGLPNSQT